MVFATSTVAPLPLRAGESVTVGVAAEAVAAGAANGLLRVELDDGEVVVVDLTASGFERTDAFLVQLTWVGDVDVDLHVAHPGTDWCSNDDLYFAGASRIWGGAATLTADPNGVGPENANIEAPEDGSYTVGVGVHDGVSDTTAFVRIFSGGRLEFEGVHAISGGQQWLPARIDVTGGIITVVTLDDTSAQAGACWNN